MSGKGESPQDEKCKEPLGLLIDLPPSLIPNHHTPPSTLSFPSCTTRPPPARQSVTAKSPTSTPPELPRPRPPMPATRFRRPLHSSKSSHSHSPEVKSKPYCPENSPSSPLLPTSRKGRRDSFVKVVPEEGGERRGGDGRRELAEKVNDVAKALAPASGEPV
eukprot:1324980-Amorphochlora_amoeboformis.AAC.1